MSFEPSALSYGRAALRRRCRASFGHPDSTRDILNGKSVKTGTASGNLMTDSDYLTIAVFVLLIVIALLLPPGPGTPLRSPVGAR